jgi:hypothetical protein
MVTISQTVQNLLNKRIFLQEVITQGIVSFNRLADNIKPEIESELGRTVGHNAVVMAIRRYAKNLDKKQQNVSFDYFRETLLKTDVCYVIVEESPTVLNKIQSIYNKMVFKHGKIFNIVHGNYEIGIITNQSNKEKILDGLSDENVLRTIDDLVVISLMYSGDYLFTPGIIYNVLRFVAWENINVLNITLTPQELNVVVSRDEAMRTYDILAKLVKTSKNNGEKIEEIVC